MLHAVLFRSVPRNEGYAYTRNTALTTSCIILEVSLNYYNSDGPKVSWYSSVIIVKNRDTQCTTPRPV